MKGRTTCPKCEHTFVLDAPSHVTKHSVTCPKCGHNFNINPSKTSRIVDQDEDYSWEECGEPRKTVLSALKERTNKPMIAGTLLIVAFVLGASWGGSFVFADSLLKDSMRQTTITGITGSINGTVTDQNNTPLLGVNITVETMNMSTTTNENGSYSLTKIPLGIHRLNLTKEGYRTQIYEILISPFQTTTYNMKMTSVGNQSEYPAENHTIDQLWSKIRTSLFFCSAVFIVFAIFALVGAVYAIKRKQYPVAIIGSIFGILSFGFLIGSICSIIALVLLIISKEEFEHGESKEL